MLMCRAYILVNRPYVFNIFMGYPFENLFSDNFKNGNPPCENHNIDFQRGEIPLFLKNVSGCNRVSPRKIAKCIGPIL